MSRLLRAGAFRPNARVVIENNVLGGRTIEIATNSLGYRNREIGPKSERRFLFLGDSITFGDFLHEEETFVRLVEDLAQTEKLAWETVNAGIGGISLANELAILEETGLSLSPDAVVVCYYLNDYHESPGIVIQSAPPSLAWSNLAAHLWFSLPRLLSLPAGVLRPAVNRPDIETWRNEFTEFLAASNANPSAEQKSCYNGVLKAFGDWDSAWSPHPWPFVLPYLAQIQNLAHRHDFQLFIVAFPVRAQVQTSINDNYPQQRIRDFAAEQNIPFLDILPVLRNARVATPIFYDHCHHTPEGNRLIAEAIYRFLSQHIPNREL